MVIYPFVILKITTYMVNMYLLIFVTTVGQVILADSDLNRNTVGQDIFADMIFSRIAENSISWT